MIPRLPFEILLNESFNKMTRRRIRMTKREKTKKKLLPTISFATILSPHHHALSYTQQQRTERDSDERDDDDGFVDEMDTQLEMVWETTMWPWK